MTNKDDEEFFNKVKLGNKSILKRKYGNWNITITKLTDGFHFKGRMRSRKHLVNVDSAFTGVSEKYVGNKLKDYIKAFLIELNLIDRNNRESYKENTG
jgi:hypothetical protein